MSEYIKLKEAPALVFRMPECGACSVELSYDDGLICPVCGTAWASDATDGETGNLFEYWSGEQLDGEPMGEEAAEDAGHRHKRNEMQEFYKRWGWCEHGAAAKCFVAGCPGGGSQ